MRKWSGLLSFFVQKLESNYERIAQFQRETPIYDILEQRNNLKKKKPPSMKELLGEPKYFLSIVMQLGYDKYDLDMVEIEELNAYNMAMNYYEE